MRIRGEGMIMNKMFLVRENGSWKWEKEWELEMGKSKGEKCNKIIFMPSIG